MKFLEYKVGHTIGEGTFGKVKIGTYIPTGEKVAIKILNKADLKKSEADRKKVIEDMEKLRVLKAKQQIYRDALKRIQNEGEQEDLSDFIKKVKDEAEMISPSIKKEVSVAEYLSEFLNEVLLLMRFDHPNIIKTYKVIECVNYVYIIMQYAEGGELSDYIAKRGKLDEEEARRLFRQLLSGMCFVHGSNVAHRDLKLENVLLDEHCNALISDFGLGKQFHDNELLRTFCGTPLYSAPEIVKKIPYDGRKSDIWALGVILYSMTAGTLPFDGKSMEQVHFGILRGQFDVPDHFSRELTDLLRNMFAVDPSIRIDIEKLMESGWVNKGYSQPPAKLTPPKRNKDTLAKAISSIYVDDNGNTIYNVHSHLRLKLQKQIAAFEGKHSNSSLSKLKKKKNIVSQQSSENVKRGYSSDSESTTGNLSASPSESPISIVTPQKMDFKEISNQMSNISVLAEVSREVSESMLPSPLTTQLQVPQFWSPRRSFDKIPSPVEKNRRNRSASCGMADQPSISSTSELQSARELSIVRRMTSVSAHGSANCSSESIVDVGKIEFKEINDWHLIHKPAKEIRTKKLLFRKGLTTALDPPSMFQDLHKALVELRQIFTDLKITRVDDYYGFYVIFNTDYPVQLHIELCNSWFTNSKGLRIKNLQGDADQFVSLLINKLAW